MRSIIVLLLMVTWYEGHTQIKVNSPYEKDKTYIPDGDESNSGSNTNGNPGTSNTSRPPMYGQEVMVRQVIEGLFDAMFDANGSRARSMFLPEGRIISKDENGSIRVVSADQFVSMLSNLGRGRYKEEIKDIEIKIDDYLASAWVNYNLYVDGNYDHCGVDAFQLHYTGATWKILQIADTRRSDCRPMGEAALVNTLLDNWHLAASNANATDYFDDLADDAVYLGTDPTEHWDKDAFIKFAKPFFDKGAAWDFKPKKREVSFSEDSTIAWFDELLETWMGPCRGSGVLSKDDQGRWKIKQYNLAVLVPNDKIQEYIRIRK